MQLHIQSAGRMEIQTQSESEKEKTWARDTTHLTQALSVTVYIILAHNIDNDNISRNISIFLSCSSLGKSKSS